MENFADRLNQAIRDRKTPACVGLDPVLARLPKTVCAEYPMENGRTSAAAVNAIVAFGRGVIEAVAPLVPVMKINVAFFEAYGGRGVDAYRELIGVARRAGLLTIGDVKRGDIGHSSAAYAQGQLAGGDAPDAITVNPYLGLDGVKPFIDVCREEGKGIFSLVQTSNESASAVQDVRLESGETVAAHVGGLVNDWAGDEQLMGSAGYSAVGAVVSPRDVAGADGLRTILRRCIFLVPGYGAQGQSAGRVAHCFKEDGSGAIVNSSRGVIYAHANDRYAELAASGWQKCVEAACQDFVADLDRVQNR
ncbi:MAG: orotidine-5'-phosphate decarboxylase [bacterium]|nr:orotidine-5'-phosphate decarboxylase [bacterium]